MDKDDILKTLSALKPELAQYKVKELALFGSFIRGEQNPSSDIDILVDFDEDASLFDLIRIGDYLEKKMALKVDIIPKESLRQELQESILKEMVVV